MRTIYRICIEDYTIPRPDPVDENKYFTLKRGQEYLTSEEENDKVFVHSSYWFWAPANIFAGPKVFTEI